MDLSRFRHICLPGIPVHNAIATNKLSSSTGTVVSTARLIKNKKVDWGFVPGTVIGALIGSVAGANLALIISDHILKMVLVVILPIGSLLCVERQEHGCGSSGRNDKEQAVSDRNCMLFGDWLL